MVISRYRCPYDRDCIYFVNNNERKGRRMYIFSQIPAEHCIIPEAAYTRFQILASDFLWILGSFNLPNVVRNFQILVVILR